MGGIVFSLLCGRFEFGIAAEVSCCKNGLNSPERVVLLFCKTWVSGEKAEKVVKTVITSVGTSSSGEEERVLIDCSLCETYGEFESLALEASSSDVGSLKIESKIIDLGYLGSQFTWRYKILQGSVMCIRA
ncbi:hypothetical protein RYX36_016755 [Vicia faba]